jgi:hypothetical protein
MLLRFVPLAANARIPSHAAVFVCLGAAVLMANAVASSRGRWPAWAAGALLGLVLADFWVAPFPMQPLEASPVYARLATRPPGAVLELPLGIRDGFSMEGTFDPSVLYHQTIHGKPLAGGYLSRLSPVIRARYHESPALDALLRLSGDAGDDGAAVVAAEVARDELGRSGIQYIVLNTATANPALREYVAAMGLTLIDLEGMRQVYRVEP